jgi:hypothetical protein
MSRGTFSEHPLPVPYKSQEVIFIIKDVSDEFLFHLAKLAK